MEEFLNKISDIRFDDITELYERREEIKGKYLRLPLGYKELYKWYYFYQLCILNYGLKSAMWTYLNTEMYNSEVNLELALEYSKFLRKRDKILKIYKEEEELDDLLLEKKEKEL